MRTRQCFFFGIFLFFMNVLFHRVLEHFWKIFDLVYCQVLLKYISFVFNRFLSWPTILCKIFWKKLRNQANLRGDVVFVGRREMKIFSTVFWDFGQNMVGKRYFQHYTLPVITGKNNEKSGFEVITNGISIFEHFLKKIIFWF